MQNNWDPGLQEIFLKIINLEVISIKIVYKNALLFLNKVTFALNFDQISLFSSFVPDKDNIYLINTRFSDLKFEDLRNICSVAQWYYLVVLGSLYSSQCQILTDMF